LHGSALLGFSLWRFSHRRQLRVFGRTTPIFRFRLMGVAMYRRMASLVLASWNLMLAVVPAMAASPSTA